MLLDKHNIRYVQVPPICTDKLQPLDIAINKPLKDELKKQFHTWYASEVHKQLETTPVHDVKVDMRMTIIKAKSVRCFFMPGKLLKLDLKYPSMDLGELVYLKLSENFQVNDIYTPCSQC